MAKTTDETVKKPKKRKSEVLDKEQAGVVGPADAPEVASVMKAKKKKSEPTAVEPPAPAVVEQQPVSEFASEDVPAIDRSKKAKKRKTADVEVEVVPEPEPPKKRKKKAKEQEPAPAPPAPIEEQPEKERKSKNSKAEVVDEDPKPEKKKKSKSKEAKSSHPAPKEDDSLPPPAKKAITYARQYALSVSSQPVPGWKFNKVLQKWLIKNALDPDVVGEKYVDVCFKYLRTVKGGAYQQVEELCQLVLDAPAGVHGEKQPVAVPDGAEDKGEEKKEEEEKEDKQPAVERYSKDRARVLMGMLQSAG